MILTGSPRRNLGSVPRCSYTPFLVPYNTKTQETLWVCDITFFAPMLTFSHFLSCCDSVLMLEMSFLVPGMKSHIGTHSSMCQHGDFLGLSFLGLHVESRTMVRQFWHAIWKKRDLYAYLGQESGTTSYLGEKAEFRKEELFV
jgi:hypothetical protein